MADISYRDLAEFGLPLVPPVDPSFRDLVRGIQSGPYPLPAWDMTDASESAPC